MIISELNIFFTIDQNTLGIVTPQLNLQPIRWNYDITKNKNSLKHSLGNHNQVLEKQFQQFYFLL